MSHEVETMAYSGDVPWHGLGVKIDGTATPEEIMKIAGLDWTVSKQPIFRKDGRLIASDELLVRDTDDKEFAIVGADWKPVQNAKVFDFFKRYTDAGSMKMETAGALRGGRFVWALAELDGAFYAGRGGDEVKSYMLLMSPHVPGYSLIGQLTPVRVVCWNTLNYALGDAIMKQERRWGGSNKGVGNKVFRMHHSVEFDGDVKADAVLAVDTAMEQMAQFKQVANLLARATISVKDTTDYFFKVLRVDDETVEKILGGDKKEPRTLTKMNHALLHAPGADMVSAKGTLWGAVNAVTYVVDHEMGKSRDTALASAWIGEGAAMKRRAVDLAVQMASAA